MHNRTCIRRPRALTAALGSLAFLLFLGIGARAQSTTEPTRGTGSVSGEISIEGQPAANITVMASAKPPYPGMNSKTFARTKTDSVGRYQLRDLPPGKMIIAPQAPSFIVANESETSTTRRFETEISLDEGETLKDINFTMARGGVITGRVTTEDGRPVIAQQVMLTAAPAETANGAPPVPANNYRRSGANTDDRGVYRIYGIEPGRYLISCGREPNSASPTETISFGGGVSYYARVYYPAATDSNEASVIDVTAGSETANIDLRLGKLLHGFKVSGRVTNGANGSPVKNIYLRALPTEPRSGVYANAIANTDENGEFTFSGLQNGSYKISGLNISERDAETEGLYVPETKFEVADDDVSGLEIKAKRGLTISGTVVLENTSNDALPVRVTDLSLFIFMQDSVTRERHSANFPVNPDSTFTSSGLQPGKVSFGTWSMIKGLSLRAVERGGIAQPGAVFDTNSTAEPSDSAGIVFDREHPITDVVLRVVYGNCRLRGQVVLADGTTPSAQEPINLKRTDGTGSPLKQRPDSRGRFLFEGLTPGQYEVRVGQGPVKVVTVANGADNSVTLTAGPTTGGEQ